MLEKILIFGGLALFLLSATIPFWQGEAPEVKPNLLIAKGGQCVAPVEYMRENHMILLNEWRDSVVRDGERFHIMSDGSKVEKSLTKTCLGCHVSQKQFCEECHSYAGVKPYCWECHIKDNLQITNTTRIPAKIANSQLAFNNLSKNANRQLSTVNRKNEMSND